MYGSSDEIREWCGTYVALQPVRSAPQLNSGVGPAAAVLAGRTAGPLSGDDRAAVDTDRAEGAAPSARADRPVVQPNGGGGDRDDAEAEQDLALAIAVLLGRAPRAEDAGLDHENGPSVYEFHRNRLRLETI